MTAPTPEADTVRRTAALARLDISPEESRKLGAQFQRILSAFHQLLELEVEEEEDAIPSADLRSGPREDVVHPSLPPDQILANAPEREGDFYVVPKTVGGEP